jgi:3-hydroxyacyl-CoA dehydrogenase
MTVTTTTENRVGIITIDNPPVNALSRGVPEAIAGAVEAFQQDPSVLAIVVIGAGRTFIAGADINDLQKAAWGNTSDAPDLHAFLATIEDSAKPVVMAIHGTALGGGLETAMAAHYRVAVRDALLGQPEVNLGVIPGAEGTQRLPRLVGVQKAIEMCVSGKPISATAALEAGLIDRIIDGDLAAGAIAFAREVSERGGQAKKTRDRQEKLGTPEINAPLFAAGRELARRTRKNQIAPLAAVDAIEAAASMPYEDGCRREREIFFQCVASEQGKALIHAFFAERGVSKVPGVPKEAAGVTIKRVGIVGAGTMGRGIAMACANAGLTVMLDDSTQDALDAGLVAMRKNYDTSVASGRFTREQVDERMGRVIPSLGGHGFEEADLIIEAVFEDMRLKKQVFARVDRIAKPGAILATNTSTLDIDEIASVTSRKDRVAGLHFFSPANIMRLLEIVRGKATDPAVLAAALGFSKQLKKVGVVVGNGPGFVGNRMMFPYMYEAQFLVEDGATPEQVDKGLTDWGMAMGIFAVDDMAGRDVAARVRKELKHFESAGGRKPLAAEKLDALGRFGQKTGKGWYKYDDGRKPISDPDVLAIIEQTSAEAGIKRRQFTAEEIVERLVFALINEGARALGEGLALRAADIDVIYINGYGFPAWRGGPMFYADRVGLKTIYERVCDFHRQFGERWEPAPLLKRLAAEGSTFRELDAEHAA